MKLPSVKLPNIAAATKVPALEGRNFIPTTPTAVDRKAIQIARVGRVRKAFGV